MRKQILHILCVVSFFGLLAGCPPPCEIPGRIDVPYNDPELLGQWEGQVRPVTGRPFAATMDFMEESFRLEVFTDQGDLYVEGRWGTSIHDNDWNRLDMNIGCANFELSGTGYEVWQYEVVEGRLIFASHGDFVSGEGSELQDGPFYEFSRVR